MDISVKLQIPFQHHMLILHVADQQRLVSGIQFVHSDLSLHPIKMQVFLNYKQLFSKRQKEPAIRNIQYPSSGTQLHDILVTLLEDLTMTFSYADVTYSQDCRTVLGLKYINLTKQPTFCNTTTGLNDILGSDLGCRLTV